MSFIFEALITIRGNTLDAIAPLTNVQLLKIPEGFGNNIMWNLGHMVVTQQILCYKLGGATPMIPDSYIDQFKKGSSPKNWASAPSLDEIKNYFKITNEAFFQDYKQGAFSNYRAYKTSSGLELKSIDDALIYNYGHENLHYGIILNLKKLV